MTKPEPKPKRPRTIADDIIDAVESATRKWTRQKKSEERHPGNIRYRLSRMTKVSRITQKEAAWEYMEEAYMAASGGGRLPASVRQIYYQIRPKVMAATDNKELKYDYFSQTLLPDYIEENGVAWRVVYDARGHFEEPHTNRRMGCGTIEVNNYLRSIKAPTIEDADFEDAGVNVIGPAGGFSGVLFCEKEGFGPLFRSVKLADRYDLMIVSTKGVSVTAARRLIESICGGRGLPLFVLHDFDVAGFLSSARSSATPVAIGFPALSQFTTLGFGWPTSRGWRANRPPRPGPTATRWRRNWPRTARLEPRSASCSTIGSS
jgi:hypothetical protein